MEQRLAAVLAADMVGYSRLMEADERGTLARLRTHRIELIDPAIDKNNGRIIKTTGDGMLVEFSSVADAVRCALEVQERMRRRNSDVPNDRRIEFRIGINLGDIVFEDGDIFGDGVNIASRVEQLAEVGGICVTAAVHGQVEGAWKRRSRTRAKPLKTSAAGAPIVCWPAPPRVRGPPTNATVVPRRRRCGPASPCCPSPI